MLHFLLDTVYDTNQTAAYGLLAAIVISAVPPFRRVALAIWRYVQNDTPPWARRLLAACVAFPGFWDEIVAFLAILVYVLASRKRRTELAACIVTAWQN
jgi:hypothetical protein